MQLSAKTQNACLAALELARRHDDPRPVCVKSIATAHQLSPQFLVQILQQLKRAGLVTSIRGASGGYRLAHDPDTISLLDIVVAFEGVPAELTIDRKNPLGKALIDRWAQVALGYEQSLAEVTLRMLVESVETSTSAGMYYI